MRSSRLKSTAFDQSAVGPKSNAFHNVSIDCILEYTLLKYMF